jgi:putative transposase
MQCLEIEHYLNSSFEKSWIERVMQYFNDRTESFDDYYQCMQNDECNLFHVYNWIQFFFVSIYNDTTFENYFINELSERGE